MEISDIYNEKKKYRKQTQYQIFMYFKLNFNKKPCILIVHDLAMIHVKNNYVIISTARPF